MHEQNPGRRTFLREGSLPSAQQAVGGFSLDAAEGNNNEGPSSDAAGPSSDHETHGIEGQLLDGYCLRCRRKFKNFAGLRQHERKMHPDEYFAEEAEKVKSSTKHRWTDIEELEMARLEVGLIKNNVRFINKALEPLVNRTSEAIKGKRKAERYRQLVAKLLEESTSTQDTDSLESVEGTRQETGPRGLVEEESREVIDQHTTPMGAVEADVSVTDDPDKTLIWGTVEYYLDELNSDLSLSPRPADLEIKLLDQALLISLTDPEHAKVLCHEYLAWVFGYDIGNRVKECVEKTLRPHRRQASNKYKSKRQMKKEQYALFQKQYRKNRSRAFQRIFNPVSCSDELRPESVFDFWSHFLTRSSLNCGDLPNNYVGDEDKANSISHLTDFVSILEVRNTFLSVGTSAGLDGISVKDVKRKVPVRALAKLFTLWSRLCWVPQYFLDSRTSFIPKVANSNSPSDLRPISVSSVLLRHYHKILNARLIKCISFTSNQFGFQPMDGIAKAVECLDTVYKVFKSKFNSFSAAFIDMCKAFDSIAFDAIYTALKLIGIPDSFIKYIKFIYTHAKTYLLFGGCYSEPVRPKRGVRQGDPLSSTLFLAVLDFVLRSLDENLGTSFTDNSRICFLAYADDVLLLARDAVCLQKLLNLFVKALNSTGLVINVGKSFTFSWLANKKRRKVVFDATSRFLVYNRPLKIMPFTSSFQYLGVTYTPDGRVFGNVDIGKDLLTLKRSPTKPQQRIFFLRTMLIPRYMHLLVLGKIHCGYLRKIDLKIRRFVREVLRLPHDTPNSAMYAKVCDGGLGLPCLRWIVPMLAYHRLRFGRDRLWNLLRAPNGALLTSRTRIDTYFKRDLHARCDGLGLAQSSGVPIAHSWVSDGSSLMSGSEYISSIKVRYNCLFSRSRRSRGRDLIRYCSRGCAQPETMNHMLQVCYATHGLRVRRHNDICSYVKRSLEQKGLTVHFEPQFKYNDLVLKPDLVAYSNNNVFILDIQIINDQFNLRVAHMNKVTKYEVLRPQLDPLRPGGAVFMSLTVNWRGVFSVESFRLLTACHLLRPPDFRVLAARVLRWGFRLWHVHQHMTSVIGKKDCPATRRVP